MNSVSVHIDTSGIREAAVTLTIGGQAFVKQVTHDHLRAQVLLPLLDDMLREHDRSVSDITAITVMTGPGSFTGLRVGIAVANALGTLLGIPVNGKRAIVTPEYS